MSKNIKNLSLENNISKDYFQTASYLKDKIRLNKIIKSIFNNLDIKKDSFHILSKKFTINLNKSDLNKFKKYKNTVIIGMGGSTLGAKSIYFFLKEKISKNFIFLDNLDQSKIEQIKKRKILNNSFFIIISKSGNTIETLINTNLLKNKISSKNTIIITEQKNNLLNTFATKKKNIKIEKIRKNLLSFFNSKQNLILVDSIVKLAHIHNSKKIKSVIFLNYAPQLNEFLYWCQQLIAESLGKKGKGILPVVSPAPRDHHSLLQLYLDGPKDKLFYIFSLNLNKKMKIKYNVFGKFFEFVKNKELSKVVLSQKKALTRVLRKKNIPFREFKINQINEEVLGELFSYFTLETALTGKLIGVNPFTQPAVEEVKFLTKQYLS